MKEIIKITELPKVNIFKVPEGYFDSLSMSIQEKVTLSEEPVVSFGKKQNFAVPDKYFDTLSSRIMSRITNPEEKQEIKLENLPKVNVFMVPEGYFESAGERTRANVWIESLEKKNIFDVPADYFEELPARILSQTQEGKTIKVNWWQKSRVLWTAAASLVLMLGVGFAVPQFLQSESDAAFEAISKEEIDNYLATQDLSYLEYDVATATETALPKGIETRIIDDLKINKTDILEHLENQDLEDI